MTDKRARLRPSSSASAKAAPFFKKLILLIGLLNKILFK